MHVTTYTDVRLEDWTKGPFQVADTDAAWANKAGLEAHFEAEWSGDLDTTMQTIHPEEPWQIVHGLGVEVRGFEAVRDYYARRFTSWPGPAMDHFTRVTVGDTCIYCEGVLELEPQGDFAGRSAAGSKISVPACIVVDFRDGLVLGETVYLDSATAKQQLGPAGDA